MRDWRAANADRLRTYTASYYAKNADAIRERSRIYGRAHKAARSARGRAWDAANPALKKQLWAEWYARPENKARVRAYGRGRRERLGETRLAEVRRWFREHPEKNRAYAHQRRVLRSAAGGNYTITEWTALVKVWKGCCAYCGIRPDLLSVDHRTPLSRGGTNSIENILPACLPCNKKKHAMTEAEFRARRDLDPRLRHTLDSRLASA